MRKWELIKQSKLLKIQSKIILNLFNKKCGFKLGEFDTTRTEIVNLKKVKHSGSCGMWWTTYYC